MLLSLSLVGEAVDVLVLADALLGIDHDQPLPRGVGLAALLGDVVARHRSIVVRGGVVALQYPLLRIRLHPQLAVVVEVGVVELPVGRAVDVVLLRHEHRVLRVGGIGDDLGLRARAVQVGVEVYIPRFRDEIVSRYYPVPIRHIVFFAIES